MTDLPNGDGPSSAGEARRPRPVPAEETTLDRILRIAAELFAANGYHATGMTELSAALKLSKGAIYYHVSGKEDLLYEISRAQLGRLNAQARQVTALDLPAEERLRLLARSLLANISAHLAEWTVFFREFGALSGQRRERIFAARDEFEQCWADVLAAGTREGVFRDSSPLLIKGILGMFNYTYLWFRSTGEYSAEQVADQFLDTLLAGLLARPARTG